MPTGIATDATTAPFFAALVSQKRLVSLHDFQTGLGFFDRIGHARFKFCLLTMCGPGNGSETVEFSFFSRTIADFADQRRHFSMSRDDITRVNPDTKTAPIFRVRADAALATKMSHVASRGERPFRWINLRQNVFTASNPDDLAEFARTKLSNEITIAVFRGSMLHQYDHRFATLLNGSFQKTEQSYRDDAYSVTSDKNVSEKYFQVRVRSKHIREDFHLSIRRIARSTDERTMIAAMLPRVGTDDTASIITTDADIQVECALLANLNSLVLDYACAHKIGGTDIRKHNFVQLPIFSPRIYTADDLAFIVPRVLELTYTSSSMTPFARGLGYGGPPFAWNEDRRALLRAELDAWYARAYGLSRDELRYILDPADVKGSDYPSETFRVLKNNEKTRYGEYRTARLVLAAWDAQEARPVAAQ